MTTSAQNPAAESSIPDDYPGRVTAYPEGVAELVLGIFGFQASDPLTAKKAQQELCLLTQGDAEPDRVECANYVDPQGAHCELLLAYWLGEDTYRRWWSRADVRDWWASLPGDADDDLGAWREVMVTGPQRHQYASGQEDPAGPSAIMPLVPSDQFGFKGSYRARLAGSTTDDFASPVEALTPPAPADAKGRRLTVQVPDNVCFIREGQTWDLCSPEELEIWHTSMDPVIDGWVATLRDNPVGTGCLSIRDCREQDASGAEVDRRSQFAFLLSLGHIERAARTDPSHLKLMKTFNDMYAQLSFAPRMNIWVEVHIPKPGGIEAEYVNCHGRTGFLPFLPSTETSATGMSATETGTGA